jgi:hypothetical protein
VNDGAFSVKKTAMNMAYVNAQLGCVNPAYSASFEVAADSSVDDEIQIYFAGAKSRWSIQIGADYYGINEIGFEDGEIEWLKDRYVSRSKRCGVTRFDYHASSFNQIWHRRQIVAVVLAESFEAVERAPRALSRLC